MLRRLLSSAPACAPRTIHRYVAAILLASGLVTPLRGESLPIVTDYAPVAGFQLATLEIFGSGFGSDPERFAAIIRKPGTPLGATATAVQSINSVLEFEIDPVAIEFKGQLELQLGQRLALAGQTIESQGRQFQVTDVRWFEGLCHWNVGAFDVTRLTPPGAAASGSGHHLLMPDPLPMHNGINRCIVISSTPPPPCLVPPQDPGDDGKPPDSGAFTAHLQMMQLQGDPAGPAERVTALATAINQALGAFGLTATTQGDWLSISALGLEGGFASLTECGGES